MEGWQAVGCNSRAVRSQGHAVVSSPRADCTAGQRPIVPAYFVSPYSCALHLQALPFITCPNPLFHDSHSVKM